MKINFRKFACLFFAMLVVLCVHTCVLAEDNELVDFEQVGPIWVPDGYCDLEGNIILTTDGATVPLQAIFTGKEDVAVSWEVLDGKDLIHLTPNTSDTAVAKALDNGTATVIAYLEDGSQTSSVRKIIVTNQTADVVAQAKITINAEGSGSVSRDYGTENEANLGTNYVMDFPCGTVMSLTAVEADADNPKFLYWMVKRDNNQQTMVSKEKTYNFIVGTNEEITAVFDKSSSSNGTYFEFIGSNLFARRRYVNKLPITSIPTAPYQRNNTFVKWVSEQVDADTVLADNQITREELTEPTSFKAEYVTDDADITITVNGGSGSGTYEYGETVSVSLTATPETGKQFLFWSKDGSAVSYDTTYVFSAMQDCTISAVFGEAATEDGVVMVMQQPVDDGNVIAFTFERYVPESYTFISSGFIVSKNQNCALGESANLMEAKSYRGAVRTQFTKSLTKESDVSTYYARGYVIYEDSEGVKLIYSTPKKITIE